MAKADIPGTFSCNQCGTVEGQRQGRGRRFTKCLSCRTVAPPGSNALRIANAACNQTHACEGCGLAFKPKRAGRTRFCSRDCAYRTKTAQAAGPRRAPRPYERKPPRLRACAQCGETFEARLGSLCSNACRMERAKQAARESAKKGSVRDRSPRTCRECSVIFIPVYGMKRRSFCSQNCCDRSGRRTARLKGKARKRSATVESVNPTRVFERDGWRCHLCAGLTLKAKRGTYHPNAPELDHIVPLSKGGEHSYRNTACAHRKCNADKSDKIMGQPSLLAA